MSPTGWRRTATRGVFAIEDQALVLPDPIALDTSFVVEALLSTQPLHAVCDDFLTRIGDSDITVVTSDLLAVELAETAFCDRLEGTLGQTLARTPHRRTRPPPRHTSAERHDLPLRDTVLVDRSLPCAPRRHSNRRETS